MTWLDVAWSSASYTLSRRWLLSAPQSHLEEENGACKKKKPTSVSFSIFFLQQRFLPFLHIPPKESGGGFFPYSFSFWKSGLSDLPFTLTAQTQTTLSLSHPLTRSPSLFSQLHFPPKLKLHYAAVLHSQPKVIICRRRRCPPSLVVWMRVWRRESLRSFNYCRGGGHGLRLHGVCFLKKKIIICLFIFEILPLCSSLRRGCGGRWGVKADRNDDVFAFAPAEKRL